MIMTQSNGSYEDGDIVYGRSINEALWIHAQEFAHPLKTSGLKLNGLREDGIGRDWLEVISEYRFERISSTLVTRTNLRTLAQQTIGPPGYVGNPDAPFGKEHIYVQLHLDSLLDSPNHQIYGEVGSEVWYGGSLFFDPVTVSNIWDVVESYTPNRRTNPVFQTWPYTPAMKREFLVLKLASDLSDATRKLLATGGGGKKRTRQVRYWEREGSIGETASRIRNRTIEIDIATEFDMATMVAVKP